MQAGEGQRPQWGLKENDETLNDYREFCEFRAAQQARRANDTLAASVMAVQPAPTARLQQPFFMSAAGSGLQQQQQQLQQQTQQQMPQQLPQQMQMPMQQQMQQQSRSTSHAISVRPSLASRVDRDMVAMVASVSASAPLRVMAVDYSQDRWAVEAGAQLFGIGDTSSTFVRGDRNLLFQLTQPMGYFFVQRIGEGGQLLRVFLDSGSQPCLMTPEAIKALSAKGVNIRVYDSVVGLELQGFNAQQLYGFVGKVAVLVFIFPDNKFVELVFGVLGTELEPAKNLLGGSFLHAFKAELLFGEELVACKVGGTRYCHLMAAEDPNGVIPTQSQVAASLRFHAPALPEATVNELVVEQACSGSGGSGI